MPSWSLVFRLLRARTHKGLQPFWSTRRRLEFLTRECNERVYSRKLPTLIAHCENLSSAKVHNRAWRLVES